MDEAVVDTICAGVFPCQAVLENSRLLFQQVDTQNAAVMSLFVSKMFQSNPIECTDINADFLLRHRPFRCAELEIDIYQACQVRSCSYWTPNSWTRNCIVDYFAETRQESATRPQSQKVNQVSDLLELKEIAFLLDVGIPGARQRLEEAFKEARFWALKDRIRKADELSEASSEPTPLPPQEAIESEEEAEIRARFKISSPRVIRIATESFASLKAASAAVAIQPDRFLSLCQQYSIPATHLV